jgi:CRP/FNR family transcriptional regulator
MNAATSRKPKRDPHLIEGVLANLPLMEGVSPSVVRQLSTQSVLIHARRGEILVRRGEPVGGLYAIAYGKVKKRLLPPAGAEVVLALLGPGDTFAEVPALLASPSRLDAVALSDAMVVRINASCIAKEMANDPRLARNVSSALARRMQALLEEFERVRLPAVTRLAGYLLLIAEGDLARLPMSKTLLAARLDMKKETLSRLLRGLAARGLIAVAGREIRIVDRGGLAALVR